MHNEQEIQGKLYRYDPEYDCWYRIYNREEISHWDKWSYVYVCAMLCILIMVTV